MWGHYRGVEVFLHQIPAAMRSQAEVTLPVINFMRASWAAQTCLLFARPIALTLVPPLNVLVPPRSVLRVAP